MRITRTHLWRVGLSASLGLMVLSMGFSQPEGRGRGGFEPPMIDRTVVRERLAQRLERSKASSAALESAIASLDQGEEIGKILSTLGPVVREDLPGLLEGMRQNAGLGRNGGPEHPARTVFDAEAVSAFIDRELPWLSERLRDAEARSPGSRMEMIRRVGPEVQEILTMMNDEPELADLRLEQMRLGAELIDTMRRVRRAMDAGEMTQEEARSTVRGVATEHVMLRERIARVEIESLRKKLAERETELELAVDDRERVIANMTERMMRRGFGPRREGQGEPRGGDAQPKQP